MLLAALFVLRFTSSSLHPEKRIKYAITLVGSGGGKDFIKAHDLVAQQRRQIKFASPIARSRPHSGLSYLERNT